MEHQHPAEEPSSPAGCAQCGFPVIEEGYPTPLCATCRKAFVRFPIPNGIKIFGGVIVLVLVFAMIKVPKSLSAGIHLERGKDAIDHARYATAEKEFQQVVRQAPKYTEGEEYLALASFYNGDLSTFFQTVEHLEGKNVENEDMYRELSRLIAKGPNYFPADSLFAIYTAYHQSFDSIPAPVYLAYMQKYPDELFPVMMYASVVFNQKQYVACDSLLDVVLQRDDIYLPALLMKASVKRERSQLDSAEHYGRRILSLNSESAMGMSSLARTRLKGKRDKEGLDWAQKAVAVNPDNVYAKATLAMAWHFNNERVKRDRLLDELKKDTAATEHMTYVVDVIEGREKFRD